jgi:hypothetical protein
LDIAVEGKGVQFEYDVRRIICLEDSNQLTKIAVVHLRQHPKLAQKRHLHNIDHTLPFPLSCAKYTERLNDFMATSLPVAKLTALYTQAVMPFPIFFIALKALWKPNCTMNLRLRMRANAYRCGFCSYRAESSTKQLENCLKMKRMPEGSPSRLAAGGGLLMI